MASRKKISKPTELRVLCVTPSYHVLDGVVLTIHKIRKEVEAQGGTFKVLTAECAGKFLDKNDSAIMYASSLQLPYDTHDNYSVCMMLNNATKKKILDYNPTVIHVTAPDPLCFSVCRWARNNGLALMATWHSNIPDYLNHYGFIQRVILKNILIYVFQTQYSYCPMTFVPQPKLKERMIREGYENPYTKNKLGVWGRGVDTDLFTPKKRSAEYRKRNGASEDDVVVLWVGRCVTEKEPVIYTKVMTELTKKYEKVKGWVVGRGEEYDHMIAVHNVTGFGWRGREELAEAYANADILFFPSKVETFGNVTLEAMSSGLASLVDKTCSSHLIEHGKVGYACDTLEEYHLYAEKLVQDTATRKAMCVAAREKAESTYELRHVLGQIVDRYIEVSNTPDEDLFKFSPQLRHYVALFLYSFVDYGGYFLVKLLGYLAFYGKSASSQVVIFIGLAFAVYLVTYLPAFLLGVL